MSKQEYFESEENQHNQIFVKQREESRDEEDDDDEDDDEDVSNNTITTNKKENGKGSARSQNNQQSNKKPRKMFMCTFNGCGKSYSHTSGIRHHQREKHGQYNPEYYQKVDQTKSKEKRGRPKLQIKKEIQQTNLEDFFQKLSRQEEEEYKKNPELAKKAIKYQDKMMSFLLEKNIKFILAVITEFGDPIVHKCRNNIFIEEWDQFQSDPWKTNENKIIQWDEFFGDQGIKHIFEDAVYDQSDNKQRQMKAQLLKDKQLRMREFVQRVVQDLKQDIWTDFLEIFKQIWSHFFNKNLNEQQVVEKICSNLSKFKIFDHLNIQSENELTKEEFVQYLVHGILAYVNETPNELYDNYFGYGNNN